MWQRGKCATEDRKCFCVNRNLRKQGRRGERRRKQQQQKSQDVCRDKPLVNLISNQINVSVLAVLLREEPKIDIYKYQRERGGDFNLNFDWDFKQMDLFLLYRSFFSYLCCFFFCYVLAVPPLFSSSLVTRWFPIHLIFEPSRRREGWNSIWILPSSGRISTILFQLRAILLQSRFVMPGGKENRFAGRRRWARTRPL